MLEEPNFPHIPAEVVAQEAAAIWMANVQVSRTAQNVEVIGTTPTGLMVSISHDAWSRLLGGGNAAPQVQGGSLGQQAVGGDAAPQPQAGPSSGPRPKVPQRPATNLATAHRTLQRQINSSRHTSSVAELGIILHQVEASYNMSQYPHNCGITFKIFSYIEVNGMRRLLNIRSIPE